MKSVYSIAMLALLATTNLAAQNIEPKTKMQIQYARTGQEVVQSIRVGFEAGSYDAFLANLQSDYEKFTQEGNLDEFIAMRETPEADERLNALGVHFEQMMQKLISDRDDALRQVISESSDVHINRIVESVIAQMPDDQKDAIYYLFSLRFKNPSVVANDDEKKLIELDIAADFKMVHLDSQFVQKPFDDRAEKHLVIMMDVLRQMQGASQSFTDLQLRNKIDLAIIAFDAWQARSLDMNAMYRMAKSPRNELEKKIASILMDYQAQKEALYQKEFLANVPK